MDNTEILTIKEIADALKDRKLYHVANATGLSYPTVKKFADGKDENYTLDTIKKISEYILLNSKSYDREG